MARTIAMTYPLDKPIEIRPGVMHREADFHGSAKWYALPPEAPDRARGGDLSMTTIKDFAPRALTSPGAPFVLKGK